MNLYPKIHLNQNIIALGDLRVSIRNWGNQLNALLRNLYIQSYIKEMKYLLKGTASNQIVDKIDHQSKNTVKSQYKQNQQKNAVKSQYKQDEAKTQSNREWSDKDEINHIKFYLKDFIKFPYLQYPYGKSKTRNRTYRRMALAIQTKNQQQCRLHDLHLNRKNKAKKNLIDYTIARGNKYKYDPSVKSLIQALQKVRLKKSDHMKLIQRLTQESTKQIQQIKQLIDKVAPMKMLRKKK